MAGKFTKTNYIVSKIIIIVSNIVCEDPQSLFGMSGHCMERLRAPNATYCEGNHFFVRFKYSVACINCMLIRELYMMVVY